MSVRTVSAVVPEVHTFETVAFAAVPGEHTHERVGSLVAAAARLPGEVRSQERKFEIPALKAALKGVLPLEVGWGP